MQATLDNRQYETFNNPWHTVSRESRNRSSFNSTNSFSSLSSAFGATPMRAMNSFAAPRTLIQPAVYPQMSRNTGSSYNPFGSSAQLAGQGLSRMPPGSITNFSREVVKTPDGGKISKVSITQVRPPVNQYNPRPEPNRCDTNRYDPNRCDTNRPDPNRCDTNRRGYDDRCWDDKSKYTPHVPMTVNAKGNDLDVRMGNDTKLETKKSDSDLFINTKTKDGHDVSISSKGDPHASFSIDGKEVAKGDYKDPFRVKVDDKDITMIPETKQNNNGPAPYLDKAVIQQKDGSMYVMEHLSQADKSSNPTYREVTDAGERKALSDVANKAHTATYENGKMIDSTTGKQMTNADINAH
jgi:hypothetical protein